MYFFILFFIRKGEGKKFLGSWYAEYLEEEILWVLQDLLDVSEEKVGAKSEDWVHIGKDFKDLIFVI